MKTVLKPFELYFYVLTWGFATSYTLFELYKAQNEFLRKDKLYRIQQDLEPGWSFLGRFRDVTDIEWSSWKFLFHSAWCTLITQFIISESIRRVAPNVLKYWYILASIFIIAWHVDVKQLLIILVQPTLYLVMLLCGGKKTATWILSAISIITFNSLKNKHFFWQYLDRDDLHDEEVYLVFFCIAWIELRCISFSLDYIEKAEKAIDSKDKAIKQNIKTQETIVNMFSYVLYAPVLYTGPLMLYEEFEKSFYVQCDPLSKRVKKFSCDMILFLLYTLLMDLSLHYMYFYAMQTDVEILKSLPSLALCGGGFWMGIEFHMKYVISYGTTAAFCRLDNMDPPPTPRCIARVHLYSQMWRYFDVGLYRFLVKYIYHPVSKMLLQNSYYNLPAFIYKQMASLITFVFIFFWHGTVLDILIWSCLNYIGITLEQLGRSLTKTNFYKRFKVNILRNEQMETRFIALVCTPLLALSAISNFYLFAGSNVGILYFQCFLNPSLLISLFVTFALYSCCHAGIALEDVGTRFDKR